MSVVQVLTAGGILRAPEVVELAAAARLDLACAAVLLTKESGGGRNVFGHDPVPTGGAYDKGSEVTRENYAAYRAALAAGQAGRQGVGPCQLTLTIFQDQADQVGGCWSWRANCLTGFRVLAALIRVHGERGGFRRYNGSGPAAEAYADDAAAKLTRWRNLLAGQPAQEAENMPANMPLSADEIERIARRTADLTWLRPTANSFGDVVEAQQIVNGVEKRVADLQAAQVDGPPLAPVINMDDLADRIVARLVARAAAAQPGEV